MSRTLRILALLGVMTFGSVAQAETTAKVGVVLPLTGALTEYGVASRNGIELARKERPELFEKVQFVYEDSEFDMKRAISAFRKLQTEGVALTYVWGTNPSSAVVPLADAVRAPLIAYTTEPLAGEGREFVIRFCSHEGQQAKAILDYMRSKGFKKIGIVKTELVFFNGVLRDLRPMLHSDESISVHEVAPNESDFRSVITKLKSEKVDGLVVLLVSGQISNFYRQAEQLRFKVATVGTDFFDSLTEVEQAGGAMEGAVFPAHYVDKGFAKKYRDTYGNDLQLAIAAIAYDFALKTGRVFSDDSFPNSGEAVLRHFQALDTKTPFATEFVYDPSVHGFDFRLILRKVSGGRIVDVVQ